MDYKGSVVYVYMDWEGEEEEEGSTVLMAAAGNLDLVVDIYWEEVANTMAVEEGKHRKGKVVVKMVEESRKKEVVVDYNR